MKSKLSQQIRVGHIISMLERVLRAELIAALAPLDITLPQFVSLFILRGRGPMSNAALARASMMTPQSASEVVSALVEKGLFEKRSDPGHRRIRLISITPAGAKVLERADAEVLKVEQRMLGNMDIEDQMDFSARLMACVGNLGNPSALERIMDTRSGKT